MDANIALFVKKCKSPCKSFLPNRIFAPKQPPPLALETRKGVSSTFYPPFAHFHFIRWHEELELKWTATCFLIIHITHDCKRDMLKILISINDFVQQEHNFFLY